MNDTAESIFRDYAPPVRVRPLPPDVVGGRRPPLGEKVHIRTHGVTISGLPVIAKPSKEVERNKKRGLQVKLSKKSVKRLRGLLVGMAIPESAAVYSVSWTVPGPVVTCETWRALWQALRHRLTRAGVSGVWRVELQKRKQPHVHAVAWCCDRLLGQDGAGGATDGWLAMTDGWHQILKRRGHWTRGASERSVIALRQDRLADHCNWYRYLCGHLGKEKAEQLGWVGRQWGSFGDVETDEGEHQDISRGAFYRVRRVYRRMLRMRRGLRGGYGKTDIICSPLTARRIVEWASAYEPF